MTPDIKVNKWLYPCLFLLIIAYPVFGVLDILPIRLWDESRLAINAYDPTIGW